MVNKDASRATDVFEGPLVALLDEWLHFRTMVMFIDILLCLPILNFMVELGEDKPVLADVVRYKQDSEELTDYFEAVYYEDLLIIINMILIFILTQLLIIKCAEAEFVNCHFYERYKHLITEIIVQSYNPEPFSNPKKPQPIIKFGEQ